MSMLLESVLTVRQDSPDTFIGQSPRSALPRLFGGHITAQMLTAAGRTADAGLTVHSVHACFVRPGLMGQQVEYRVERVRDTRSFSTRSVVARQGRAVIATATVSMHRPEDGPLLRTPMPEVPGPDDLPRGQAPVQLVRRWRREWPDWEIRMVPRAVAASGGDVKGNLASVQVWIRHSGPTAEEIGNQAAIAYASDITLGLTSLASRSLPLAGHGVFLSSLDHVIWFHAASGADEWLLHDQEAVVSENGRTLCCGRIYSEDGRHIATVMQETLIRQRS